MPISANLSFDDMMAYAKYRKECIAEGSTPLTPVQWFEKFRPGTIERT